MMSLGVPFVQSGALTLRPKSASGGVPGPGQYGYDSSIVPRQVSKSATSFGYSGRPSPATEGTLTPGPAAYDPTATVAAPVSHRRSTPNIVFSKSARDPDDRWAMQYWRVVGPCAHACALWSIPLQEQGCNVPLRWQYDDIVQVSCTACPRHSWPWCIRHK